MVCTHFILAVIACCTLTPLFRGSRFFFVLVFTRYHSTYLLPLTLTASSQVSTSAASTKAEDTVPPSGMTQGRSENAPLSKSDSLLNRRKANESLELELPVVTNTPTPVNTGSPSGAAVYPFSADLLSDRETRSMSEERCVRL